MTKILRTLISARKSALGGLLGLSLSLAAGALEPPLRINFQGKLLDAGNNPRNGAVDLQFRFYDAPTGGTQLQVEGVNWSETVAGVPVSNGVFSVQIGTKTALHPDLFSGTSAYLDIQVDAANAGGPAGYQTLLPRQSLVMSPYALSASQLVSKNGIRVNSGLNYSTFTVGGDLRLPYGLWAGTGSFTGGITASSGSFLAAGADQFSLYTASGIYMSSGTLYAAGGGGVLVRYGLFATTGNFSESLYAQGITGSSATLSASGANQFSLVTASGVYVSSGILFNNAGGGILNTYGVVSATANFVSVSTYSVKTASGILVQSGTLALSPNAEGYGFAPMAVSSRAAGLGIPAGTGIDFATFTLVANTETLLVSTGIAPTSAKKRVLVMGETVVIRSGGAGECYARLRSAAAAACTATSAVLKSQHLSTPNAVWSSGLTLTHLDSPASADTVNYCMTIRCVTAQFVISPTLTLLEIAP